MTYLKVFAILNHNVVRCYKENDKREFLAFGRGIGFNRKIGDVFKPDEVQNVYEIRDLKNYNKYEKLLSVVDSEILEVSEQVISDVAKKFGNDYDENIHISLLDHINFSVKRLKENIVIENIFIDEIEYLYPKEFHFAKEMLQKINQKLNINLPKSEAGFLCMHIYSALNRENVGYNNLIVQIINDCMKIIDEKLDIDSDDYSLSKQRLVTHLKFAVKRSLDQITLDNLLKDVIQKKYNKSYNLAKLIAKHIEDKYGITLGEGEICYLSVHIENIVADKKRNK